MPVALALVLSDLDHVDVVEEEAVEALVEDLVLGDLEQLVAVARLRRVGEPLVLPVLPGREAVGLQPLVPAPPLLDRPDAQVGEHVGALGLDRGDVGGLRLLAVDDDEVEVGVALADRLARRRRECRCRSRTRTTRASRPRWAARSAGALDDRVRAATAASAATPAIGAPRLITSPIDRLSIVALQDRLGLV